MRVERVGTTVPGTGTNRVPPAQLASAAGDLAGAVTMAF